MAWWEFLMVGTSKNLMVGMSMVGMVRRSNLMVGMGEGKTGSR
jgi:hypothetical protein